MANKQFTYHKSYHGQEIISINLGNLTEFALTLRTDQLGYSLDPDPMEALLDIQALLGEADTALQYFDIKVTGQAIYYPAYLDLFLAYRVVEEADAILNGEESQLTNIELDQNKVLKTAAEFIANGDSDAGYAQIMGLDYYRKLLNGYYGGDDKVFDYYNSYVLIILSLLSLYVGHAVPAE